MSDIENALPALMYRDPSESLDEIRRQREVIKRKAERERKHKSRRIQALVRHVVKNGGVNHDK
ncbi:MAG: hypothetical protein COX55_03570 [Zetaproteobacteria bacterium CG23_combo_of_CG06-09_8_20_14_all_54_7]|nr:MAG: hypothetical protein COX55_03570 [Zetaproteobacteria bacterium CG23_combo_of_CG06-09_8_20_14_all_54_7]